MGERADKRGSFIGVVGPGSWWRPCWGVWYPGLGMAGRVIKPRRSSCVCTQGRLWRRNKWGETIARRCSQTKGDYCTRRGVSVTSARDQVYQQSWRWYEKCEQWRKLISTVSFLFICLDLNVRLCLGEVMVKSGNFLPTSKSRHRSFSR